MARALRSSALAMLLAAAALAAPAAAEAAGITYSRSDGGVVTYTADAGETLDLSVGYEASCVSGYNCVTFYGGSAPRRDDAEASTACAPESGGVMSCVLDNDHSGVHIIGDSGNDNVVVYEQDPSGFPAGSQDHIVVDGGDGNDTLIGGDAADTLNGGPGNDWLTGRGGDDTLDGGDGNDKLWGDADNDKYSNMSAGGSDVLHGGAGDDQLTGDGWDVNSPIGHDVLDGGAGTDTVYNDWYRFDGSGHDEDAPPTVTFDGQANDGRSNENDNVLNVEGIDTGYLPDQATQASFTGTDAAETFILLADSTVKAGGGDDRVTGSDAVDTIDGGAGNDRLGGGFGDDVITGGPGQDDISGDRTAACEYGPIFGTCTIGTGNDTIYAQDGEKDTVDCGPGADTAYVDAIDTVANCETVHVTGSPAPGPQPGPQPGPVPVPIVCCSPPPGPPAPALTTGHQRLRTIVKHRRIRLTCALTRAGRCAVRVSIRARDARKLHLRVRRKAKTLTLGRGAATLAAAGKHTIQVRLSRRTAHRLRHARRLRLTFTTTATYGSGTRATKATTKRTITVRR